MKLDEVIRSYMVEKDFSTERDYRRMYQMSVRCLRELHSDVVGVPTFCALSLDSNGQADLPTDMIAFIRVGVMNSYGELVSFGENQRLAYPQDTDDCGDPERFPVRKSTNFQSQSWTYDQPNRSGHINAHGEVTGGFFGTTGRVAIGEYKINYDTGKLMVSNITDQGSIVLEYLADLSRVGEDYEVHPYLEDVIFGWLDWKLADAKKSVSRGEKDYLMRDYYRRKRNLRFKKLNKNTDTLMQYARKNRKPIKF